MVTGTQVAEKAKSLLLMGTIPYVANGSTIKGMDCQGLVEWVLRELGIKADYRGTNDMWRNMLSEKGTIEEGVSLHGEIPLGSCIFIVVHDGGEPDTYQDAEGNCEHVYIKISEELLIHASQSNQMVCTRTFADKTIPNGGPTHYGLISGITYDGIERDEGNSSGSAAGGTSSKKFRPLFSNLRFAQGDIGGGPREIQAALKMCGYDINVDGEFGPITESIVIRFQKEQDLKADGIVGENTWQALIEAANKA